MRYENLKLGEFYVLNFDGYTMGYFQYVKQCEFVGVFKTVVSTSYKHEDIYILIYVIFQGLFFGP